MKNNITLLLLFMVVFHGCLTDPDPIPNTINSSLTFYNCLAEPYDVQWEIDDEIIGTGHSYGNPAQAIAVLDQPEQEVLVRVRDPETDHVVVSLSSLLVENAFYMLYVMGTEEDPYLLCESMDPRAASAGKIKLRFIHTSMTMGPIDIYIGGDLPENKELSGVSYSSVSNYLELSEEELWNSVIITPENTLPADSTILSYTANHDFRGGWVYLCSIGHSDNSPESSYRMQIDKQAVF